MTFNFNLDGVKINQHAKHQASSLIVQTHAHTGLHWNNYSTRTTKIVGNNSVNDSMT